jgi:hypothetical protein
MRKLAIILVSLITAFTSITPVQAFPSVNMATAVKNPDVIDVRHRRYYRYGRDHYRYGWRDDRRHYRRHHHHGGAILGGLAAGLIFGSMLAYPPYYGPRAYYGPGAYYVPRAYYAPRAYYSPRVYYGSNAHVRSCYARYRSYRAWDNTYQPYYGPRRPCL